MKINDDVRVESIWDHKNGKRFQMLVVNKEQDSNFTVHHDTMGRLYVKVKLSETDVMQLIQELHKNYQTGGNVLSLSSDKTKLKLVTGQDGENG